VGRCLDRVLRACSRRPARSKRLVPSIAAGNHDLPRACRRLTDPPVSPDHDQSRHDLHNRIATIFAGAHVKPNYPEPAGLTPCQCPAHDRGDVRVAQIGCATAQCAQRRHSTRSASATRWHATTAAPRRLVNAEQLSGVTIERLGDRPRKEGLPNPRPKPPRRVHAAIPLGRLVGRSIPLSQRRQCCLHLRHRPHRRRRRQGGLC
jgi:hypothetical protein